MCVLGVCGKWAGVGMVVQGAVVMELVCSMGGLVVRCIANACETRVEGVEGTGGVGGVRHVHCSGKGVHGVECSTCCSC